MQESGGSRVPHSDAPRAGAGPFFHLYFIFESRLCTFMHTFSPEFEMSLDMQTAYPYPVHMLCPEGIGEKRKVAQGLPLHSCFGT